MKFVVSLAEQGFGSILTFAINLWLIRSGATQSYGVYVFWLSVAWVLGTAQGTLVIAHLFRLPSARDRLEERRQPERLLLSLALGISLLCAVGVALGDWVLAVSGSELASPGAVLFIPAFLLFQYVRAFTFSRQRPKLAACLTGGVLAAAVLLLGGDFLLGFHPDAERVLFLTAAAYGGCSAAVLLVLLRGMLPMLEPAEIRRYLGVLRGVRLAGAGRRVGRGDEPALQLCRGRRLRPGRAGGAVGGAGGDPPRLDAVRRLVLHRLPPDGGVPGGRRPGGAGARHAGGRQR